MNPLPNCTEDNIQAFLDLLSDLRGVVETKVLVGKEEVWIGLRTGKNRPANLLLQQVSRAAVGFGLSARTVHFGILAD